MSDFEFVTIVPSGGTPIRIADQRGAPLPTTGTGPLVFGTGATLNDPILNYAVINNAEIFNPVINGSTFVGPMNVEPLMTGLKISALLMTA